jgi:thioredoxin family protein/prenyltransferase/squalene oxidase-like repeat protein
MDTVTYPDPALQELLAKFVLVKVDHDAEPALVKQYGVQPLPDVRLLAPDGRPIDKLVGFTSAKKLAAKMQSALDRIAGEAPEDAGAAAGKDHGATKKPDVDPTPDAVRLAVVRGCSFLRGEWRKGFTGNPRFLPDELVLFAWSCSGLGRSDADSAALLSHLLETPPRATYRAALRACALARLGADDLRPRLEECARFLESTQLANGQWSYGPADEGAPPSLGDNSNSAYALLGLEACRRAGVEVSRDAFFKAAGWWLRSQNDDGGFGYRSDRESASYESMTASGLHALLVAFEALGRPPNPKRARAAGESTYDFEAAILRGGSWLASHFNVRENAGSAYQEGRLLYGLYALERAGDTPATDAPPARNRLPADWFRQGAAFLLSTQRDDGSWDDGAETPIPNTGFAILFLTRAARSPRD